MAKINIVKQKEFFEEISSSLIVPVPARIRSKKYRSPLLPEVKKLLKNYQVANERYKEISQQNEPYDNGEVYIVRDVDFKGLDIQNQENDVNEIMERMENDSKLIVFLPIKTREDKNIQEHIYLSSLRAFANLLENNEEAREQFDKIHILDFPGFSESLEKVKEIFLGLDIEIFICVDSE